MGWINHPLLVGTGEVTPLSPSQPSNWSACGSITTSLTISASSLTGIEDGDYVIFYVIANQRSDTSNLAWWPTTPADNGWICLSNDTASADTNTGGMGAFGRFYSSSDTSYVFGYDPLSSPVTACWYAYAFRGVSRRVPLDYFLSRGVLPNTDWNLIRAPSSKQHGITGRWVHSTLLTTGNSGGQYLDFDNSSYYIGSTKNRLLSWDVSGPNGSRRVDQLQWERILGTPDEVVSMGNVYCQGMAGGFDGWSSVNCTITPVTSGSRTYDVLYADRGVGDVERYIYKSVDLEAGETYYFRVRAGSRTNAGYIYYCAPCVYAPSGGRTGGYVDTSNAVEFGSAAWVGLFTAPSAVYGFKDGSSGIPDSYAYDLIFPYTAAETGTHQFRIYALYSLYSTSLSYDLSGSTPISTSIVLSGAAVGHGVIPELQSQGTYASGDTRFDSTVRDIFWKFGSPEDDTWFTPHGAFVAQIVSENTESFNTVRLVDTNYAIAPFKLNSTETGITSGGSQPYGWYNADYPYVYAQGHADRPAHPGYFATEDAVSRTDGKYYWEVTIGGSGNYAGLAFGVAEASHTGTPYLSNYASGNGYSQFWIRGDGSTVDGNGTGTSWGGTLTDGDVLGFALNVPGNSLTVYENGVSVKTFTLSQATNVKYSVHMLYRPVFSYGTSSDTFATSFDFNFTGPFTYSKPVGYVAYDWLNEVA